MKQESIKRPNLNIVKIIGKIDAPEPCEENGVIEAKISSISRRGIINTIPIRMPEGIEIDPDKKYLVTGNLKSKNFDKHVKLYLQTDIIQEIDPDSEDENYVILEGHICKKNQIKIVSNKCVSSVIIVNTKNGAELFYIPVVGWHTQAIRLNNSKLGEYVKIEGWIQSRNYLKNGSLLTTYEVSVNTIKIGDE